jgi:hypothetical protein
MFTHELSPAKPVVADEMLQLPLGLLLALPPAVTRDRRAPVPNIPGIIWTLLGSAGWQRATKVISPRIWAPDWTDEQMLAFARTPFQVAKRRFPDIAISDLRAPAFPAFPDRSSETPSFAILHVVGSLSQEQGDVVLELGPSGDAIRAGGLRDALVHARTRLLVLQVPHSQRDEVRRLADDVVNSGGPAVLTIVAGVDRIYSEDELRSIRVGQAPLWNPEDVGPVEAYFLQLYANLVHHQSLSQAAHPSGDVDRLEIRLLTGVNGDQLLQLHPWINALQTRIAAAQKTAAERQEQLITLHQRKVRHLHRAQANDVDARISLAEERVSALIKGIEADSAHFSQELDFAHETGGVIPLSETADALPTIEAKLVDLQSVYPTLQAELQREISAEELKAPRVLNANFADPAKQQVLGARSVLRPEHTYDLLVDIGPRWSTIPTLVVGHADFPEGALPADVEGFTVDAMFVSNDFRPSPVAGRLWVPSRTGRSFPILDGERGSNAGPVALQVTPLSRTDVPPNVSWQATGRLSLYYQNNLLQSAVVKTGVSTTADASPDQDNSIEVDYALTGDFQEVPERYAGRAIVFGNAEPTSRAEMVRANVTLNSNGNGGHRIIITHGFEPGATSFPGPAVASSASPPAAVTAYDPAAASTTLQQARSELLNCFFDRTKLDRREDALMPDNGRSFDQFRYDLRELARLGRRLFNIATGEVDVEGAEISTTSWTKRLSTALREASVIQIARTDQANYVFPWALVYAHPLPGPKYEFCRVLDEWGSAGRRSPLHRRACPYQNEPWHQENIYCPYGFWGMKHIIEQPPGAYKRASGKLLSVAREIEAGADVNLGIGITRDVAFERRVITDHLKSLKQLDHLQFLPPDGADDVDKVRAMLEAPNIVYFLCHGKVDAEKKLAFLGVGPPDDDRRYKIFPSMIQDWTDTEVLPNLAGWANSHPLVLINGCHTADLEPGQLLNFVTAFTRAEASGVVGTEVSVRLPVAVEVAESLISKILCGIPAGQAMWLMRWELANKGSLLGLAYTLYALADLRLSRHAPAVHGST